MPSIASKSVHEDHSGVTITFTNGETLTANLIDYSPDIIKRLALHGLSQKAGDSYSGEQDLTVAVAKARNVHENLVAGNWSETRSSSAISDLAHALSSITQQPLENCVEKLQSMDDKKTKLLRAHKKIKIELQRIKLARAEAAAAASTDEALDF